MTEHDNKPYVSKLELATIAFFRGKPPAKLLLHECGLKTNPALPDHFTVLSSTGLQKAYHHVKAYAQRQNLKFTVVDLSVGLQKKLDSSSKLWVADLPNTETLMMTRVTKEVLQHLIEKQNPELVSGEFSHDGFHQRMAALAAMRDPEFNHVKLIGYPIEVPFTSEPLTGISIPKRHWNSIIQAECRLDPGIAIDISPPKGPQENESKTYQTEPEVVPETRPKPAM